MAEGAYAYMREIWRNPSQEMVSQKMTEWRNQPAVIRVEHPTRLDRARTLGYKAKKGFVVLRVKLLRGGRKRTRPAKKGRKNRRQTSRKVLKMNYQWVAEMRANSKYRNLEVLNSYPIGKDGIYYYFEVILVDPSRPEIRSDNDVKWICLPEHKGRAFRGLTSAGRKSRGLRNKGKKAAKLRPSVAAHQGTGK
ncbi:50S ribosomal protein L15e [Candidatus Pacearchaeota archaeon CG06_land_8_20_14_3_00_35_12]|nr:MAG: 50S ribosomal protein L15e [Candidatus Pacearchaeota archaeon CG06_land_8_20_14_3_00_35_12]